MPEYPTPRAVVLSSSGVFYDDRRNHPLSDRLKLSDLSGVLAGASRAFRGGEGVVIVDTPIPSAAPEVVTENWSFSELRPWTTFTGKTIAATGTIHLGFLPALTERPGPLLKGFQGPADVAWRLGRYQHLVGTPWTITAGVSGCEALRSLYTDPQPGKQPLWNSPGPGGLRGAGPLIWRSPDMPDPSSPELVVMFDVNAQYLAALKSVRLAWGALKHTGPVPFDPSWPGYWEISAADVPAELLDGRTRPPVIRAQRVHKGGLWVSTDMAKYLGELVGSFDVLDSWTSSNGQTIARPFAERLASVRAGDLGPMGPVTEAVKRTYAELVGMMGRAGGSIYRPDWHNGVMDLARCNLLRRLDKGHAKLGMRPFEIRTDAAYFLIKDRGELTRLAMALGVGTGPGTFKNPKVSTVAEHYAASAVRR